MTFARGVFIFAFLMLIVGAVGARVIIGPLLFGDVRTPSYAISARSGPTHKRVPRAALANRARPTDTPRPSATPTRPLPATVTAIPRATPTARAAPAATRIAPATTPTATSHRPAARRAATRHHRTIARATATEQPSPTASPTPSGEVTLANYWVGSSVTRPGTTIAVGYVIDNQTGATARIELGASVKASNQLNWATESISDPGHDVVAVIPPGISRHVRYFTLRPGLRAGSYDIAWGLRNPSTGSRVALVAAPSALRVQKVIPAP